MLVSDSYVKNHTFTPVILEAQALSGFEGLPQVDGYLCTAEKPTATVTLTSDTEDPLLAWWNAGAGKVGRLDQRRGGRLDGRLHGLAGRAALLRRGALPTAARRARGRASWTAQVEDGTVRIRYALRGRPLPARRRLPVALPDGTLRDPPPGRDRARAFMRAIWPAAQEGALRRSRVLYGQRRNRRTRRRAARCAASRGNMICAWQPTRAWRILRPARAAAC